MNSIDCMPLSIQKTNKLLHTKLRPTTTKVLAHSFLTELDEKHNVDDAVFLTDGSKSLRAVLPAGL
jgi:transposase-like protein